MQQTLSVTVAVTVSSPLQFSPAALPTGVAGSAYPATAVGSVSGGVGPYAFSVPATVPAGLPNAGQPNSLPAGMTLSAAGVLAGTPSSGGSFSFAVSVTDSGSVP